MGRKDSVLATAPVSISMNMSDCPLQTSTHTITICNRNSSTTSTFPLHAPIFLTAWLQISGRNAREYEGRIHDARGIDLQVLGIGSNGHIGFNEPTGSLASRTWIKILSEQTIRDNSLYFKDITKVSNHVLTMNIATVMEARQCILAFKSKRADAVRRMI